MPPAWSSRPSSGLNLTSTKPFSTELARSTHHGKVPLPDCCSTLGALGAEASCRTAQRGFPLPVTPCSQAAGSAPGAPVSKLIGCPSAAPDASNPVIATTVFVMRAPIPARGRCKSRAWTPIRAEAASVKRGVCRHPRVELHECMPLGYATQTTREIVNMADLKVLGICGSLRKASLNMAALRACSELLPAGMTLQITSIADLPMFNQDVFAAGSPEPVKRLRGEITAADGLLLASPEYNFSVSGPLKNAIDWGSRAPNQGVHGQTRGTGS